MSGSTERSSYANNQVFLVFNILSATVLAWFVLYGNIFPSHQANIHHTPAATDIMSDAVFLRNARLTAMVGLDCWHRDKKQPVLVSMTIPVEIQLAGETDDVLNTVNYGTVFKAIDKGLSGSSHNTLDSFAEEACRIGLKVGNGKRVSSTVKLPKVVKEAEGGDGGVSLEVEMVVDETGKATVHSKVLRIDNLRLACILGINDHERKGKQIVALNLELYDGKVPEKTDYQALFAPLIKVSPNSW
jgi:FolB domain-containing protein